MPMQRIDLNAAAEDAGKRLDAWLAAQPALRLTRSAVQQLLTQGQITRNGAIAKKNDKLQAGDSVAVCIPEPRSTSASRY